MRAIVDQSNTPVAVVLGIANTRHGPDARKPFAAGAAVVGRAGVDRLRSPRETGRFLEGLGLTVPTRLPTIAQLLALRDVREAVRGLAEGDQATYQRRLRKVAAAMTFRYVGLRLRPVADGWDAFVGDALQAAVELSGERARLRVCHNSACAWIFLDDSPGHAQVWCPDQRCGERIRARRYRRRRSVAFSA